MSIIEEFGGDVARAEEALLAYTQRLGPAVDGLGGSLGQLHAVPPQIDSQATNLLDQSARLQERTAVVTTTMEELTERLRERVQRLGAAGDSLVSGLEAEARTSVAKLTTLGDMATSSTNLLAKFHESHEQASQSFELVVERLGQDLTQVQSGIARLLEELGRVVSGQSEALHEVGAQVADFLERLTRTLAETREKVLGRGVEELIELLDAGLVHQLEAILSMVTQSSGIAVSLLVKELQGRGEELGSGLAGRIRSAATELAELLDKITGEIERATSPVLELWALFPNGYREPAKQLGQAAGEMAGIYPAFKKWSEWLQSHLAER